MKKHYKRALTIAGSDPSGGAGIQADLKTFSACGCYGMSAIVAVVDENTVGVTGVHPVPVDFVTGQIRSVLDDIGADAVKIGMLHSSELIRAVRQTLAAYDIRNVVLDPVMVATSGDRLLQEEAIATLKEELIPFVRVITPNIPEAEAISGLSIRSREDMERAALRISETCGCAVLCKGGHSVEDASDVLCRNGTLTWFEGTRIDNPNTHGTGCTLSSAIASFLAKGEPLPEAIRRAKEYLTGALAAMLDLGHGSGPMNHMYALRENG